MLRQGDLPSFVASAASDSLRGIILAFDRVLDIIEAIHSSSWNSNDGLYRCFVAVRPVLELTTKFQGVLVDEYGSVLANGSDGEMEVVSLKVYRILSMIEDGLLEARRALVGDFGVAN